MSSDRPDGYLYSKLRLSRGVHPFLAVCFVTLVVLLVPVEVDQVASYRRLLLILLPSIPIAGLTWRKAAVLTASVTKIAWRSFDSPASC